MFKIACALVAATANAAQWGEWGYNDPYSFVGGFDDFGFSNANSAYGYGYDNMPTWADPWGSNWNIANNDPWFGRELRNGSRQTVKDDAQGVNEVKNTDIFSFGKRDDDGADVQPYSRAANKIDGDNLGNRSAWSSFLNKHQDKLSDFNKYEKPQRSEKPERSSRPAQRSYGYGDDWGVDAAGYGGRSGYAGYDDYGYGGYGGYGGDYDRYDNDYGYGRDYDYGYNNRDYGYGRDYDYGYGRRW